MFIELLATFLKKSNRNINIQLFVHKFVLWSVQNKHYYVNNNNFRF